jgi:carbonic anhydrase
MTSVPIESSSKYTHMPMAQISFVSQPGGAVSASLEITERPGVIDSLILAIQPAVEASKGEPGDRLTNVIKANVRLQVQRLQASSVIAAALKEGKLKIVGAYYDLDTGEISLIS